MCRARIDIDLDVSKMEYTADDAGVDWGNDVASERSELCVDEAPPTQLEFTHLALALPGESSSE